MLKLLDKFLKFIKTDRNTFFTYILTLISAYIVVDRIVEMLFMIFTGMSVSYWNPIQYTLALACPVFAFLFSGPSKFNTSDKAKLAFFDVVKKKIDWMNFTMVCIEKTKINYKVAMVVFVCIVPNSICIFWC